jgi:protein involved in polysaccharide export with SLBB domain
MLSALAGTVIGQTTNRDNNLPYSPSPSGKIGDEKQAASPPAQAAVAVRQSTPAAAEEHDSTVAASSVRQPIKLTELYKIGAGDVLYVNLKNAPSGSGYYTVHSNGTIDYPLAGDNVVVADQTCDRIAQILSSRITLFPDPKIEVKVRQYASHKVLVTGLVENPGYKNLQREAVPLFVIRAEAGVTSKADKVLITRQPGSKIETYDLRVAAADNVLIYPGNEIEFAAYSVDPRNSVGSYFIAGAINSGGKKEFSIGLTLYQAIVASGGVKGNPKKVTIRRKNGKGMLTAFEYNLRWIKKGKAIDPVLLSGDMIEISH